MLRASQRREDLRRDRTRQVPAVVVGPGIDPRLRLVEPQLQLAALQHGFHLRTPGLGVDLEHAAALLHDMALEPLRDAGGGLLRKLPLVVVVFGVRNLAYEDALRGEVELHRRNSSPRHCATHLEHIDHDGAALRRGEHHVAAFEPVHVAREAPQGFVAVLAGLEALPNGRGKRREVDVRLRHVPCPVPVLEPGIAAAAPSRGVGRCGRREAGHGVLPAQAPCDVRSPRIAGREGLLHGRRDALGVGTGIILLRAGPKAERRGNRERPADKCVSFHSS